MANDLRRPIRRACLAALKGDGALTAIIPAASLYPQTTPPNVSWPFGKIGVVNIYPVRAGCVDGCLGIFAVHGFAKARFDEAGAMVETAEDHADRIAAAMAKALDRRQLELETGQNVRVHWTGSPVMQDGDEADAFHAVVNFRFRALA